MSFISSLAGQLSTSGKVIVALIFIMFVLAFAANLAIRFRYIILQNDLHGMQQLKTGLFNSDLINRIITEYKSAAVGSYSEVNTQAIIEKCFNQRLRMLIMAERFVKNAVSLLIILGLLGTFLGLTMSVYELVKVLNQTNNIDFINNPGVFITGLVSAVGGMTVAFVTSLVGIACSILLTLFNIIFNAEEARETLMVHIEEYLDNKVAQVVYKDKETEYTMMNRILRETFVEFGEKIETTLQKTMDAFGDKLSHVVMDVHLSSKTLDTTIDKFDSSLKTFAENIRDFSEFNFNLRNNIERMDVSFIKVTEAMTNTSKVISDNYGMLEKFSAGIKEAAGEMTLYNRQLVQDTANLVSEVRTTVSSVRELGEAISSDMAMRTDEMGKYQEKLSSLMMRLSEEITLLGLKTSDAFAQSLADNGKAVSQNMITGVHDVLREVFQMLEGFSENEKLLARTIALLPDQTIAFNEAAAAKITRQLDEIKGSLAKPEIGE